MFIKEFYIGLSWLQNNLDGELCGNIFGKNLKNHMQDKWKRCDGNIINFITLLDDDNKQKIFDFILNSF